MAPPALQHWFYLQFFVSYSERIDHIFKNVNYSKNIFLNYLNYFLFNDIFLVGSGHLDRIRIRPKRFGSDRIRRVAGAALFGWSRSRIFGPAPTPTPTLTHRTVNILFLETLRMTMTMMTMTTTMTVTMIMTMTMTMTMTSVAEPVLF